MPNTDNINRLIQRLKDDGGVHFAMSQWMNYLRNMPGLGKLHSEAPDLRISPFDGGAFVEKYETCKTALCLAGWIDVMTAVDRGIKPEDIKVKDGHVYVRNGAEFLGITYAVAESFFKLGHYSMPVFDRYPGKLRVDVAVRALENLRDGAEYDSWQRAFESFGLISPGLRSLVRPDRARELYPDSDVDLSAPPSLMGDSQ
jgi:hypothetical protein